MENWAEIRRLHRAEGVPIKEIARRLGVARNTVRAALASDGPPRYRRAATGSLVDTVEPQVRALLREYPTMPATVIAQRIGWEHSITVLKDRVRVIRPEYRGVDPVDRLVHAGQNSADVDIERHTDGRARIARYDLSYELLYVARDQMLDVQRSRVLFGAFTPSLGSVVTLVPVGHAQRLSPVDPG